jgi:hypothetical protein
MGDEERQHEEPADGDEASADEEQEPGNGGDEGTEGKEDISDTTAPSIGPNTVIEREPPEERLARHEQSDVDAMGLDKRREVVGASYGPSFGKQATLYGVALAIIAAVVFGFILLAGELDKAPETAVDEAPWSDSTAPQEPPAPLQ